MKEICILNSKPYFKDKKMMMAIFIQYIRQLNWQYKAHENTKNSE